MAAVSWILLAAQLLLARSCATQTAPEGSLVEPPCRHDIYCFGKLLHTVQMAQLEEDSKYFVDMPMKYDPTFIWSRFNEMMNRTSGAPARESVAKFVEDNFEKPGSEFIAFHPTDWPEKPNFISKIRDNRLRAWMQDLHIAWKSLGRQVDSKVYIHPERYSSIYVPNPSIVPGGRFREFYYWDSYWVIQGLLLSEMHVTVRHMLENFLSMVKQYGMVPNGGRIYFSRRSQPPFLLPMVQLYVQETNDVDFIRTNFALLEKEYSFWRNNRTVDVVKDDRTYIMYRYNAKIGKPRPESYREDWHLVSNDTSEENRRNIFDELATACETGWDFSTRWIPHHTVNLKMLKTRSVIPVDLNSLMVKNAKILSEFASMLNLTEKEVHYRRDAEKTTEAIRNVLYDAEKGSWFDWDLTNKELGKNFYLSNIFPVWVGASSDGENLRFLDYFTQMNITTYEGGVPTSLIASGQQWDFPNSWPPLHQIMVEALEAIGTERSKQLAADQVSRWIGSVYTSYQQSQPHAMFEKYDVTHTGVPGGGGEYDVQLGFGWTNGVAMAFTARYGDRLLLPPLVAPAPSSGGAGSALLEPPLWLALALISVTLAVVLSATVG